MPRFRPLDPIVLCDACNHEFAPPRAYPSLKKHSLHSNYQPDESNASTIFATLSEIEQDLERYQDEMDRLQDLMDQLEYDRNRLQKYQNQYTYFVGSIRRIPVEIWSDIFYSCCEDEANALESGEATMLTSVIPLTAMQLSHVCSRWRQIFTSTPKLWSIIALNLESFMSANGKLLEHCLKIHLQHSQEAPLHLRLIGPDDWEEDETETRQRRKALRSILDLLMQSSNRWKSLTLELSATWWLNPIGGFASGLPVLESLVLDLENWNYRHDGSRNLTPLLQAAPLLRHMSITGDCLHIQPSPNFQPKLSSLTITDINTSVIGKLLQACPNATHVTLDGRGLCFNYRKVSPMEANPHHLIIILGTNFPDGEDILDALTLPSLTTLRVKAESDHPSEFATKSFTQLISRSNCPLRNLAFFDLKFKGTDLLHILRSVPQLRTLVLRSGSKEIRLVSDMFLREMTTMVASPEDGSTVPQPLLPRLAELELSLHEDQKELMLNMIASRHHPDAPPHHSVASLTHVTLHVIRRNPEPSEDEDEVWVEDEDEDQEDDSESDGAALKQAELSFRLRLKGLVDAGLRISAR